MTRADIEKEFTVKDGTILGPGDKFAGEPVYAPYFWDLGLHGKADHESDTEFSFNITAEQRQMWPELGRARTVFLGELDNGDVCTTTTE